MMTREHEAPRIGRVFGRVLRLSPVGVLGVVVLSALALQQNPSPGTGTLQQKIARYERPDRDEWQMPDEVIRALGVKAGMVVADIGAGSGYFTRRFARAVAPDGKVFAVDIDAEILEYLKGEAERQKLTTISIVVSREDDPLLPDDSVDLAFLCDTAHHIGERVSFYRKLLRAVKKGGRMAIIDFPPEANAKGFCPHPRDELLSPEQVIREAEQAGFTLIERFTFLPRQYFLLFEKRNMS